MGAGNVSGQLQKLCCIDGAVGRPPAQVIVRQRQLSVRVKGARVCGDTAQTEGDSRAR